MKRIVSIILTCMLSAALCAAPACAEQDWRSAYLPLIDQANANRAGELNTEYFVYDIDGDGVPELLIPRGTCEADSMLRIYGMENGEAVLRAEVSFSHSVACGVRGMNALLVHAGHMGWECGTLYTLRSGVVYSEIAFSSTQEVMEYFEFTPLPGYDFADASGLTWNGNSDDGNLDVLRRAQAFYGPAAGGVSVVGPSTDTFSALIGTVQINAASGYVSMYPQRDENAGFLRHVYNGQYPCAGRVDDWYVVLCSGYLGYVRSSSEVSFTSDGAKTYSPSGVIGAVSVNTKDMINVRAGNNKDTDLVMSVCPDAMFLCLGVDPQTGWYQILLPTGQTGYVSPKLTHLSEG